MIGEMIVWGFFSAMGWMGTNWIVKKYFLKKKLSKNKHVLFGKKEKLPDGTIHRNRTCESLAKTSP